METSVNECMKHTTTSTNKRKLLKGDSIFV